MGRNAKGMGTGGSGVSGPDTKFFPLSLLISCQNSHLPKISFCVAAAFIAVDQNGTDPCTAVRVFASAGQGDQGQHTHENTDKKNFYAHHVVILAGLKKSV
jgi:hypothetical protein